METGRENTENDDSQTNQQTNTISFVKIILSGHLNSNYLMLLLVPPALFISWAYRNMVIGIPLRLCTHWPKSSGIVDNVLGEISGGNFNAWHSSVTESRTFVIWDILFVDHQVWTFPINARYDRYPDFQPSVDLPVNIFFTKLLQSKRQIFVLLFYLIR